MKKLKNGVLYQGDCLEIMPTLAPHSVDMVLTSPPYDDLRTYGNKKLRPWDFEGVARELWRVIKPGGVVVWIVGDATIKGSETGTSFRQALFFKEIGFNLHDTMIYEKSGMAFPDKNRYHNTFEFMFIFSKGAPQSVNIIKDRPNKFIGAKGGNRRGGLCVRQTFGARFNVWRYANGRDNSTKDRVAFTHPAIFPDALARDHIVTWSNLGDIVLDPFAGSGTTGAACDNTGRRFVLIEQEKKYCDIIKKRVK